MSLRVDVSEQTGCPGGPVAGKVCVGLGQKFDIIAATDVIPAGGVVLGIKADISAVLDEKELDLDPGDAVLLYTDGATEAHNADGEMYQLQELRAAMKECGEGTAEEIVAHIFAALQAFMGDTEPHDDMTLAVLKCTKD